MLEIRASKFKTAFLVAPLLLVTTLPASAQYDRNSGQYDRNASQYRHESQRRVPPTYYNGVRDGGRGGNYDRSPRENYRPRDDDRYHQQGGIGPGKGAAIGAGAGALLGALFSGSLKGAVIGGAAGAGVGAIAGKANQDNRNRRDNY